MIVAMNVDEREKVAIMRNSKGETYEVGRSTRIQRVDPAQETRTYTRERENERERKREEERVRAWVRGWVSATTTIRQRQCDGV